MQVRQNTLMRLDHVSYVASHDQISDVVNRIGSQIGTAFVDGGIHPKFGTRNFTAPLLNAQYIEVVCPLDHPATDLTPFGRAVKKKAEMGGGWLTWVFAEDNLDAIETKLDRKAVNGLRLKPDGRELKWKQIGVKEIIDFGALPFFIQWLNNSHPSKDGNSIAEITKIVISDERKLNDSFFKSEIINGLGGIKVEWIDTELTENVKGIISVDFKFHGNLIRVD